MCKEILSICDKDHTFLQIYTDLQHKIYQHIIIIIIYMHKSISKSYKILETKYSNQQHIPKIYPNQSYKPYNVAYPLPPPPTTIHQPSLSMNNDMLKTLSDWTLLLHLTNIQSNILMYVILMHPKHGPMLTCNMFSSATYSPFL